MVAENAGNFGGEDLNIKKNNFLSVFQNKKVIIILVVLLILIYAGFFIFKALNVLKEREEKKVPPVTEKIQPSVTIALPPDFVALQKTPWNCPVIPPLCKGSSVTYKENAMFVKFNKKTSLYAVFDGEMEASSAIHPIDGKRSDQFNMITLVNRERGLKALYLFKGEMQQNRDVKQGEIIGTSSGEGLQFEENSLLMLQMLDLSNRGLPMQISEKNFLE